MKKILKMNSPEWYLIVIGLIAGNGSHLEFFQPVKSFHKLTAAILKLNISVCKSACDKKHYCKVS
jgi:hypothetical protein